MLGLDIAANRALALARKWRNLAKFRTWRPLSEAEEVRNTLKSIACGMPETGVVDDWLAGVYLRQKGPALIRSGRAAADWFCQPDVTDRDPAGFFLAACLWQETNPRVPIPLPFWLAAEAHHHRLTLKIGVAWLMEYLECVTASATVGLRELARLQQIEKKGRSLGATKRSQLPAAVDAVVRAHIVTAATLAKSIGVTPRAAGDLLNDLTKAGIVREATGQASWRAYLLTELR